MVYDKIWQSQMFLDQIKTMPIFKDLLLQYAESKPFSGMKIAIAHVLVPNTLPMIMSCAIGGGELIITNFEGSNPHPEVITFLRDLDIEVNLEFNNAEECDVAIDCGAYFLQHPPKYGIVEVTRSGIIEYEKDVKRVIVNADDTKSKLIETFFGNPISVLYNLESYFGDPKSFLKDKKVGIMGFGKIGKGNARLFKSYCEVKIYDICQDALRLANKLGFETQTVVEGEKIPSEAVQDIDILITSTGYKGVVSRFFNKIDLENKLLLNLGAVDEFGSDYSEKDIFKSKNYPFNFNSNPPTPNMFIDAILSAQVEGLRYLITTDLEPGLYPLPVEIDELIVNRFTTLHDFDLSDIEIYFTVNT